MRAKLEKKNFILIFAHNRVGKTRLSMEFKDLGRVKNENPEKEKRDTLYFNAFTEDLFTWDNDLDGDSERFIEMIYWSRFFKGFKELNLETAVYEYVRRYADFEFRIDYDAWEIRFSRGDADNIKISRGEQSIFIWCVFLAIIELVLDGDEAYEGIRYIYIDDPISSLDDGNAIIMACDLAKLLREKNEKQIEKKAREAEKNNGEEVVVTKTVISSHHGLFFHVLSKELDDAGRYFLDKDKEPEKYHLNDIKKKSFFYHLAMLEELQEAVETGVLYTYHFNIMRNVLEKTSVFLGFKKFSDCIHTKDDEGLYARALNVFSHSNHPFYNPKEMNPDTKELFKKILDGFIKQYGSESLEQQKKEKT